MLYQAELLPVKYGAPERSRTHNLLIRSQTLYPIELRAHFLLFINRNGAEDRNRTGTVVTYRRILSPVRLPVPPPRRYKKRYKNKKMFKGGNRIRTGGKGFADLCLTTWLCRHNMERKTGFEPATPTLARWCSTTELLPQFIMKSPKKINSLGSIKIMSHEGLEPSTL